MVPDTSALTICCSESACGPVRFLKAFLAFHHVSLETMFCYEQVEIVSSKLKESEDEIRFIVSKIVVQKHISFEYLISVQNLGSPPFKQCSYTSWWQVGVCVLYTVVSESFMTTPAQCYVTAWCRTSWCVTAAIINLLSGGGEKLAELLILHRSQDTRSYRKMGNLAALKTL